MQAKFKNQQKVICVKTSEDLAIIVNHHYKIEGSSEDEYKRSCRLIGTPYNSVYPFTTDIYYCLSDKNFEYVDMYHENYFMTLKEYRKLKLQKIDESR